MPTPFRTVFLAFAALVFAACGLADFRLPSAEISWAFPLLEEGRVVCEGEIVGSLQMAGGGLVIAATRAGRVYAVEAAPPAVRWEYAAKAPVDLPAAAGESRVLVVDRNGGLSGLDLEGKLVWEVKLEGTVGPGPVAAAGRAFLALEGTKIKAFDLGRGTEAWSVAVPAAIRSHFAPWRGGVAFGTADKKVHLLAPDGRVVKTREVTAALVGPAFAAGDILVASLEDNSIVAWDLPSLDRRWSVRLGGGLAAAPAFDGRRLFAVLSNHVLFCLSAGSGTTLWWNSLPGRGLYPPAVAGTHVFATAPSPSVAAFPILGGPRVEAFAAPQDIHAGPLWVAPTLWVGTFDPGSGRTTILVLKTPPPPAKEKKS
jgi:outer membrane protein assembly factor BamB